MLNKFPFILLFFFCVSINAQDSLVLAEKKTVHYSEKDIKVDTSLVIPLKFNQKLKEKYNDDDFKYEVKIAEKGLWDRFTEWLAYWFKRLFNLSDGVSNNAVDVTLKILATLIVLYVIYLIVKVVLNNEGQWIFSKSTTKKIINHDDIELNLQHVDFEKLIASTLKSGNQRLAIRYYYLWLLKKMSEKHIIEWNPEKTNSDYLYEIQIQSLKNEFSYLSYLYNYIWYGEFEITEASFDTIKKTFDTTIQSIN